MNTILILHANGSLNTEKKQSLFVDLSKDELAVIKLLREPSPRDDLIRAIKMSTSEANSLLSVMEIKGIIKEELGEIRLI